MNDDDDANHHGPVSTSGINKFVFTFLHTVEFHERDKKFVCLLEREWIQP